MAIAATTKMSSKGQIVIPEAIRNRLGLKPGMRFVIVGEDDVVLLKTVRPPSMSDFDALIQKARQAARSANMKRPDVARAIAKSRSRR